MSLFHLQYLRRSWRFQRERLTRPLRARNSQGTQEARLRTGPAARDHIILRQTFSPNRRVTVPDHKEVAKGTLRAMIREVGLTVDEFKNLL
jgi:hypothetical protein